MCGLRLHTICDAENTEEMRKEREGGVSGRRRKGEREVGGGRRGRKGERERGEEGVRKVRSTHVVERDKKGWREARERV